MNVFIFLLITVVVGGYSHPTSITTTTRDHEYDRSWRFARDTVTSDPQEVNDLDQANKKHEVEISVLTLNCFEAAYKVLSVQWLKDDHVIQNGERFNVSDNHSLVIYNPESGDSGRYVCRATGKYDTTDTAVIHLDISDDDKGFSMSMIPGNPPRTGVPAQVTLTSIQTTYTPGSDVTLECSVIDHSLLRTATWSKDGHEVTSGGRLQVSPGEIGDHLNERVYLLEIAAIQATDAGNYTCHGHGSPPGEASLQLTVSDQ